MAKIIIPTPLRKFTGNQSTIEVEGTTVGESISGLVGSFPELSRHLLDEEGKIRGFVNLFVGDDNIRSLQKTATPVESGSIISIVPAIAGGRP